MVLTEKLSTKLRILDEALTLFSERGYDAVTVAQIADAVGIKAPSLYKHYKSKQDIFDAILAEMDVRYQAQAASMQLDGSVPQKDLALYLHISPQMLVQMGRELFQYFLHDSYLRRFRKLLHIEQYHSAALAALYAKQYADDPLSYQGMLLGMLAKAGALRAEPPHLMALQFYAPLFLLLELCDCQPQREEEALRLLEEHILQFGRLYRREEETP